MTVITPQCLACEPHTHQSNSQITLEAFDSKKENLWAILSQQRQEVMKVISASSAKVLKRQYWNSAAYMELIERFRFFRFVFISCSLTASVWKTYLDIWLPREEQPTLQLSSLFPGILSYLLIEKEIKLILLSISPCVCFQCVIFLSFSEKLPTLLVELILFICDIRCLQIKHLTVKEWTFLASFPTQCSIYWSFCKVVRVYN